MSHTDKNIDQLFLRKSFHELTKEEKLEISEFAKTESEFNDTKMMLISVEKELNSIKDIEPKESIKTHLLNEFNKIRPAKSSRSMGLGIFFPSDKPFHRKLGVQIIAIAAAIVLMFTFLDPGKDKLTQGSETAAVEEKEQINEDLIIKEIDSNKEVASKDEENLNKEVDYSPTNHLENDKVTDNKIVAAEKVDLPLPPPPPTYVTTGVNDQEASTIAKAKKENDQSEINFASDELAEDGIDLDDSNMENQDMTVVMDELSKANVTAGNASKDYSDMNVSPSVDNNETFAAATSATEAEKSRTMSTPQLESIVKVKSSKTLAENKELIKHFYTAM